MSKRAIRLVVLGLAAALCGCQDVRVMQKRPFVPEAEREPWAVARQPETAVEIEEIEVVPVAKAPAKSDGKIKPMTGSWDKGPGKTVPATGEYYIVKKNDILGRIARKYHTTARKMAEYNGFDANDPIKVGQKLQIPPEGYAGGAAADPGRSAGKSSKTENPRSRSAEKSEPAPADGLYTVVAGDSIGKIANRFGVRQQELLTVNHLDARAVIRPGQRLLIPVPGSVAEAAKPAVTEKAATTVPAAPENVQNDLEIGEEEFLSGEGAAVLIDEDVSVEVFAAQQGTTVEALGKVNIMPADGMFRKDSIITLPAR